MTAPASKAIVTSRDAVGEQDLDVAGPERFEVDNTGTLRLITNDARVVAAFAPGRWLAVRIAPAVPGDGLTDAELIAAAQARGLTLDGSSSQPVDEPPPDPTPVEEPAPDAPVVDQPAEETSTP
jgi:hypothetical protein